MSKSDKIVACGLVLSLVLFISALGLVFYSHNTLMLMRSERVRLRNYILLQEREIGQMVELILLEREFQIYGELVRLELVESRLK